MEKSHQVMDFEPWLASLGNGRSKGERELLRRAFKLASRAHANQMRASGEPYIQHCLAVAQMLAELRRALEAYRADGQAFGPFKQIATSYIAFSRCCRSTAQQSRSINCF